MQPLCSPHNRSFTLFRLTPTLLVGRVAHLSSFPSFWSHLGEAPLDGNHATAHAYEQDPSPLKVNLGRGVYKDDSGKSWILPSVQNAEMHMASKPFGHEYLPFSGVPEFTKATAEFAFGTHSDVVRNKQVATVQTISGTGALRVGAEFLSRFRPSDSPAIVYLPDPTYVNHYPILKTTGFEIRPYRYYGHRSNTLDLPGMLQDIKAAPAKSVILLHACAHNPTGIDPTTEEWKEIALAVKSRNLIPFFDSAYQGFASGDPDRDAFSFRHFLSEGLMVLVAQSYAKNFGLYGQRVGALNVITSSPKETKAVLSNLNQVIRYKPYALTRREPHGLSQRCLGMRSCVSNVLLRMKDVKTMADRIKNMRDELVRSLREQGSKRDWSHIAKQIGMFAYSGLAEKEVRALRDLHVYMNLDGRMSMTGVNSKNVNYLADCMHTVTK